MKMLTAGAVVSLIVFFVGLFNAHDQWPKMGIKALGPAIFALMFFALFFAVRVGVYGE